MADEWTFAVELRPEHGRVHVYSEDLPEAIASGIDDEDARREMVEALKAAVRGRIKDGAELLPPRRPKPGEVSIALPAPLVAKAAVYSAWRRSGLTKVGLAERMGLHEGEVRRILDPDHGTRLDRLAEAAEGLGGRLRISFAEVR